MKILYLPVHSILEHDEVKLLTEIGHTVFSMDSYRNPGSPIDPIRPAIPGVFNERLSSIAMQCSKDNLHKDLIEWADIIIVMHRHDWIINNWPNIRHKKVIWRTIGQSVPWIEKELNQARSEGLKIVRYSPMEDTIPGYRGHDEIIRFYKDPEEFTNWNGSKAEVLTVAQSMKARERYCGYDLFLAATQNLPRALYGRGNEDSEYSKGYLEYEDLKQVYRDYRVYFYTGTYPASYTLNFIEAMMTGIPIVAIGPKLADLKIIPGMNAYEVHKIIKHGENGFCSDDFNELRGNLEYMLAHPDEARKIGEAGRKTAIELFGKESIKKQWQEFLNNL